MTEEDVRLALLLAELNTVQNQLRNRDSQIFQIKGWCVTTSLAVSGFAIAYHRPELLAVGAGTVLGFYLLDCQFRYYWRRADRHNRALDAHLKRIGLMNAVQGNGEINIVGTAAEHLSEASPITGNRFQQYSGRIAHEAVRPATFAIYLFILICLGLEAIFIG
jgi:hypothetical protein